MDLIDRVSGLDELNKLNVHAWIGAQRQYAAGLLTRAQIATAFNIVGFPDVERQAIQIADQIDAQSNATTKTIYIGARVESTLMLVEDYRNMLYRNQDGTVNKTLVFSVLQIAG